MRTVGTAHGKPLAKKGGGEGALTAIKVVYDHFLAADRTSEGQGAGPLRCCSSAACCRSASSRRAASRRCSSCCRRSNSLWGRGISGGHLTTESTESLLEGVIGRLRQKQNWRQNTSIQGKNTLEIELCGCGSLKIHLKIKIEIRKWKINLQFNPT